MTNSRRLPWLLGLFFLFSCQKEAPQRLTLQVGPEQVIHFVPKSGFAHYFELPGRQDILRIVLASYAVGCQEYHPPPSGEVFITITLKVPAESKINVGKYLWEGLPSLKGHELDVEDHSEVVSGLATRLAIPYIRLSEEGRTLLPGGFFELTSFEPETFGIVSGKMKFHDAQQGEIAQTALLGDISIRLCQVSLDPLRQTATTPKK